MRIASLLLALLPLVASAASPLVVYDDKLENGFGDASWNNLCYPDHNSGQSPTKATCDLTNTSPVYSGSNSIAFVASNWQGLQFITSNEFNVADYQSLTFYVNGGSAGGQKLLMYICDTSNNVMLVPQTSVASLSSDGSIPKNAWTQVTLDFNTESLTYGTFNCIVIMDGSGGSGQSPVYIDQIQLNPRTSALPSGAAVNVSVNTAAIGNAVNPQIFGVAYGNATRNAQMGYTIDRWGGNSTTRYNWQVDVHNTANDWYFENIADCTASSCTGTPPAGNTADKFISAAISGGAQPLMTIPTIGWTPRSDSPQNHPFFAGFETSKYGSQSSTDPYDPTAGNGQCNPSTNTTGYCDAGGYITGNDPTDTSTAVTPSFEAQWIAHMQSTFGMAASGGVKFFTLDNEVMLWNSTHRDVHPNPPTEDEIWGKTQSYGAAIKAQEPDALVTGPVTWGYCDLFWSAADACGASNTDRNSHGGLPFVAWYLQQVCANPLASSKRLVDYLDLHWYPQGSNVSQSNADDPATAGLRLRSLKELYDPTWVSESWIADLGDSDSNHYDKPDLIPRVTSWIGQYCAGTQLAITEYNWGGDGTVSGAVAQAEALALFARGGVGMATRWSAPNPNTRAELGFSIFLDYDGAGGKVQGNSVAATSSSNDQIGAYAFQGNGRTFVLLTNKDTATHTVSLTFDAAHTATWMLYGFTASATTLTQNASGSIVGTALALPALAPMSASLLVIPDNNEIFKNGFE